MARICLITPGHLATNPRLVKEADALTASGHTVVVIAACFLDWARTADRSFSGRPWQVVATLPFGPLAPWPVRLGQKLLHTLARQAWRMGARGPLVEAMAWHPLGLSLIRQARRTQADLYIAHYPAALPAAALAAKRWRSRYAFDAEDFHLGDPPDKPAYNSQRKLTRQIEGRWLPGAAYVTAASPGIAEAYAKAYGIAKPTTILNVFSRHEAPASPSPRGSFTPGPSLYWFSQTVGPDRGLECAVQALALSQAKPHLVLRGKANPGYKRELTAIAAQHGVAGRLHWLPPADPSVMVRLAAEHDLGLVGETGATLNHQIALANKIFTYLLAGVPAILSSIPAHRDFAERVGDPVRLYEVGSPVALATALDDLLLSPEIMALTRQDAYSLGQHELNWDREQLKLISLVDWAIS